MDGFKPVGNEKTFEVKPIGVKYQCEFCNEGEQIAVNEPIVITDGQLPALRKHKCSKCNKEMLLPKSYPYIEWIPV